MLGDSINIDMSCNLQVLKLIRKKNKNHMKEGQKSIYKNLLYESTAISTYIFFLKKDLAVSGTMKTLQYNYPATELLS